MLHDIVSFYNNYLDKYDRYLKNYDKLDYIQNNIDKTDMKINIYNAKNEVSPLNAYELDCLNHIQDMMLLCINEGAELLDIIEKQTIYIKENKLKFTIANYIIKALYFFKLVEKE